MKGFFSKWDQITFTEETLHGKLNFLRTACAQWASTYYVIHQVQVSNKNLKSLREAK